MPDGFNELCEECVNIISTAYYIIGDALFPFEAELDWFRPVFLIKSDSPTDVMV